MEQRNGKAYLISGLTLPGSPEPRNPPEIGHLRRRETKTRVEGEGRGEVSVWESKEMKKEVAEGSAVIPVRRGRRKEEKQKDREEEVGGAF